MNLQLKQKMINLTNLTNIWQLKAVILGFFLAFSFGASAQCDFTISPLNRQLSCINTAEDVVFTNVSSGLTVTGINLSKTGSNGWVHGAVSTATISNYGFVSTVVNETNTARMIGLNNNSTTNSYTDIDFAIYLQSNGIIGVFENGSSKGSFGSYSSGDTAKVAIEDGIVTYYLNSNIIYTSLNSPTYPLKVDLSMYTTGCTLEDVTISNGSDGTFTSSVTNAGTSPTYQWKLNGSNVGTNSPTYTNAAIADGDIVTCNLTLGAGACSIGVINSNTITINEVTVSDLSSVSISTTPTTSKCEKAHTVASFTGVSTILTATGNNLIKTSGNNWDGGANSIQTINDNGYVSTIVNETNTYRMFGLNSNNTTASYTDIDFAIYFEGNGNVRVYENGSSKGSFGSYSSGDTAKVVAEDGNVYYYLNSNLLYTSTNTPSFPLFVDVSLRSTGATIEEVMLVSGTAGGFTASVVNGGTTPTYQWILNGTNVGTNSSTYSNGSLAVNDVVTCDVTPDAAGCAVSVVSSNTITYKTADPAANSSVSISTVPTTSKCEKAHTVARFTGVSTNVSATGNNVIKTGATGWDGGANSIQTIDDNGYVSTVINETNTYRMFGLNANNTTASYNDIDFAFYLQGNGTVTVYENGSNKGSFGLYSTGDTAKVVAEDGNIYYYLNSNLLYTSSTTPSFPLFVDISLNTTGATIEEVMLVSGTAGNFTASIVNGGVTPSYQWQLNGTNVGTNSSTYSNGSLAVNDVVTCDVTPLASGCTVSAITSNIITYKMADPAANASVSISTVPTTSKCEKAHTVARFTGVSTNVSATGNNVIKTGATGWNGGANSIQTIDDNGYVSTVINETNTYRMFGLNANNTTASYNDIDFAFYLQGNGTVTVYENGSNKGSFGSYSTGDTAKVIAEDGNVYYYLNSNLLYTSSATPSFPLFVDISLNTNGATIEDVMLVSGTAGSFTASVVNGGATPSYQWLLNGANVGANSSTYSNGSLSVNDIVTCDVTPFATGCTVSAISSNTITYKTADPAANVSVSISTVPTTSKCEKAHSVARFTGVSTNVSATGNNVIKTGATGWNGGANSLQTINDNGYVSTIVNETNTYRMFGLNSNNTTASYYDIDFALYFQGNGTINVYENGSNKGSFGSYSTGDTAKVVAEDGNVYYYLNSNLLYTSSATPSFPLFVDISLNTSGATIEDVMLVSGTAGSFIASIVNGGATPSYQWQLNGTNVGTNSSTYSNGSLAVNDVVTCDITPDASGCTVAAITSNTITYKMADPTVNSSVSISTVPTTSICQKTLTVARFTGVSSNVTASGNNLSKSGANSWNGGANSIQTINDNGSVYTVINETNTSRMFGLNYNNTTASYTDIDFAIYLVNNGTVGIFENGSSKGSFGTYSTGDTAKVVALNGSIHYYINSTLIYSSSNTPSFPLFVDVSLNTNGATIENVMLISGSDGDFTASVVNGGASPTYQWKLNGTSVGTNSSTYTNGSLSVNDVITCDVIIDASGCTVSPIFSNSVTVFEKDCIIWDGTAYTGGSGTAGAPNNSDSTKTLYILGAGATLPGNAKVHRVVTSAAGDLTIGTGQALTIRQDIANSGTITVEDGASLVQSSLGINTNTGTGSYTIKQTGTANTLVYNVWSSPIQSANILTSFSGTNPCDIYAFQADLQAFKYDYASGFSTSCLGNAVTFGATDVLPGGDGIADVGRGYFIPNGTSALKTFSGEVNNGNLSFAITTTNVVTDVAWNGNDWNMIGNPYPGGLNATAFWNLNAVSNGSISDALYFWDVDEYATWNLSGGVANGTGVVPDGTIGLGQGFLVVAAANTNIEFNNSMRDTNNVQFFKTEMVNHNVWVNIETPSGSANTILVGYNNNASDGVDPLYDAHKLSGSANIRLASMLNNEEFVIQSFSPLSFGGQKVIPLTVFSAETGTHTFTEVRRENIEDGTTIYLRDNVTRLSYDLTKGDYTFELKANQTISNRFSLVFENNDAATSVEETVKSNFTLVTTENGYAVKNSEGIRGDIQILDVTGKVVWTKNNLNTNQVEVNLDGVSAGVYFINITNAGERVYINKVVKN